MDLKIREGIRSLYLGEENANKDHPVVRVHLSRFGTLEQRYFLAEARAYIHLKHLRKMRHIQVGLRLPELDGEPHSSWNLHTHRASPLI